MSKSVIGDDCYYFVELLLKYAGLAESLRQIVRINLSLDTIENRKKLSHDF